MANNGPTNEQQHRLQLKEYRREYWQQYYIKNRERVLQKNKEKQKAYYALNRENVLNHKKAFYQEYSDELRAERKERYWNLEKLRPKKFEPSLVTYKLNVTLTFD
jgi:hypothetical protein